MVVSSPAVANGIVYVGSFDHVVYAFGVPEDKEARSVFPSFTFLLFLVLVVLLVAAALAVVLYRRKHWQTK